MAILQYLLTNHHIFTRPQSSKHALNIYFSSLYVEVVNIIRELKVMYNTEFNQCLILLDWKDNGVVQCDLAAIQTACSKLGNLDWDPRKFAVLLLAYVLSFTQISGDVVQELRFVGGEEGAVMKKY